jgi:peptidoglycan/xylan/chitin deacetylase (PgdA/CDA1 family)
MRIYIEQNQPFYAPIKWVFALIAANKNVVFNFINTIENADLIVSNSPNSDVFLDINFYEKIENNDFNVKNPFSRFSGCRFTSYTEGSFFELKNDTKTDYLAAIFYLVNCLQEYNATSLDVHGRYQFSASWQAQTGTITQNVVQQTINLFLENQPKLRHLVSESRESCVFLTHDIDGLYNAWKTEGLWAAKNLRLDKILHLLYLEAIRRPAWFNIDDILKLHSEYDVRSTFFFLTEKGRNTEGVTHADYDVHSNKIQQLFTRIKAHKSEIGLHKSALIHADFNSELNKLPLNQIKSNRYHFLKFQLPVAWQTMEKSGVDLDASLGFAEQFGFRNGYGLPFSPYHFEEKRAMNLVVTPLNIMDGTMEYYMKMPSSEVAKTTINFMENNRKDAVLSLLWHNREFSPFRFEAYLGIYKEILTYLHDTKMPTITASEIVGIYAKTNQ